MVQLNYFSKVPLTFQILRERKRLNRDTVIIMVGEKRTGKSYGAIKISERIKQDFSVQEGLFFEPKPFILFMQKATDSVCVLDEVSVNYSSRDWYEMQNKIFNEILTTQGFRRNTIIMTLPNLMDLDKRAIRLCHLLLMTFGTGKVKCYRIKPTQFGGKIFPQGYEFLNLGLPSQKNIDAYEKMKKDWNDKKLIEDLDYIKALEDAEQSVKQFNYKEYLKAYQKGLMTYEEALIKLKKMGFFEKDISIMLNLAQKENEEKKKDKKFPF